MSLQCSRKQENPNPEILSNEVELSKADTIEEAAENPMRYLGMYRGLMPEISSDKTPVIIELSQTFSYSISMDTVISKQKTLQRGTFRWNSDGKSIILTANSGLEKEFIVGENQLILKSKSANLKFTKLSSAEAIELESKLITSEIDTFIGEKWMITSINDKPINSKGVQKDCYVYFDANRKFNAFAGCNRIGGEYTIKGDQIKMTNIMATEMACAEMETEQMLLKALAEADNIIQNNQIMHLRKKGTVLIKFEAAKKSK